VGRIVDASKPGTAIHQNGLIAKLQLDQPNANPQTIELRSPISGRIRNLFVQTGQAVAAGSEIASVDPATDQVWEALRALYIVGQFDDLPAIMPYTHDLPEVPDHIRQQAVLTEKAIRERANSQGH
jgi:pyruvate/2-oxoglutarate dehydrogenase complex dihydrolipoamide acyltransferase (E2) component